VVVFSLEKTSSGISSEGKNAAGSGGAVISSVSKKEKKSREQGLLINEALNQGIASFTPDLLYEHLVKSFSSAKNLFGPKLLRYLSGFSGSFLERNIKIPEFRKELKKNIDEKFSSLKSDGLVDDSGSFTHAGVDLASVVLAVDELDSFYKKGLFFAKKKSILGFGDVVDFRDFRKGDSFRDISVRRSVHSALRRSHSFLSVSDLRSKVRKSKSSLSIVYALDASASMRGEKLAMAKRAGISLSYKAIEEKDAVGLLVFNQEISKEIRPCDDFNFLLENLVSVRAFSQTDFSLLFDKALEIFSFVEGNKHLILLTDALPTVGFDPEEESLKKVSLLSSNNITVSLVGINLDEKGVLFAEKIVEIGRGRLYLASNISDLDIIVLDDYLSFA
jgi:Mg-chelatase subunit ChlD